MASSEAVLGSEDSSTLQFIKVRKEIQTNFSRVHQLLDRREAALLAELQELEDQAQISEIAVEIKQISESKEQLENALRGNKNKELLEQSCAPLDKKLKELKALLGKAKHVSLNWDHDMVCKLDSLAYLDTNGEVPDYKQKGEPIAVFGKHKTVLNEDPGIFGYPNGVTFENKRKLYYICDTGNDRIQVLDKSLQPLSIFSDKMDGPSDLCFLQDKLYVTQYMGHCLNVYSQDYKFIGSVGRRGSKELEFNDPRGLAISPEWNRIYICEYHNNRVQCLNIDLSFNSFITNVLGAQDVKLTPDEIVIMCSKRFCIQIYNSSHQLSREIVTQGEGSQVKRARRFCLDFNLNIIITDFEQNCVLIFSYAGELIHKFGKKGDDKGNFIGPRGVTINSDRNIVVLSENPEYCIQIF